MKKQEFLDSLEQLLWDLKEEDRREAIQYYTDYFEDAGVSEEQDVTEEFGRPEKVAARIKVEMTEEYSEYSEQGFGDVRFEENGRTMLKPIKGIFQKEEWEKVGEDIIQNKEGKEKTEKKPVGLGKIILIGILLLFAAPILLPLVLGAAALIVALVIGGIALLVSLILGIFGIMLAVGLGGLMSGGILIFHGVVRLFTVPSMGVMSLGVGGLFLAAGILATLALIWTVHNIFPRILRRTIDLSTKIFRKGGKKHEDVL